MDPFAGRSEISSEEYAAWRGAGSPTVLVPPVGEAVPDWQTSEKAFMAKVVGFATEHGWLSYHTHKSANSAPGFPDLVMVRGGSLEFAELKVGTGKPTKQQERWFGALWELEGIASTYGFDGIGVRLWYPDDWQEIERTLG
jgi:hypothetical protein